MVTTQRSGSARGSLLVLSLGSALLLVAVGGALRAGADAPEGAECLVVRGEARMQAYGYAHVVIVENICEREARCEVWTTADPTPRHSLVVPARQTGSVTTRIGSPAREVVPGHQCVLR